MSLCRSACGERGIIHKEIFFHNTSDTLVLDFSRLDRLNSILSEHLQEYNLVSAVIGVIQRQCEDPKQCRGENTALLYRAQYGKLL